MLSKKRKKWGFFSPQFCAPTQRRKNTQTHIHQTRTWLYTAISLTMTTPTGELRNTETWEYIESDSSLSSCFLFRTKIYKTAKFFRFLHRSLLSSILLYLLLTDRWPSSSLLFFLSLSSEGEIKEKMGLLEGLQCWGGIEDDYFWGWGGGCWMKTEVLALL